jgi:Cu2+-exporting ATPase
VGGLQWATSAAAVEATLAAGTIVTEMKTPTSAGTDAAIETADLVLMRSDPFDVAIGLRIGRATLPKMRQNLVWAVGYNVIALPIAAGVFVPVFGLMLRPEIAALSMSGSSLIVAVNALMLKRLKLPTPDTSTAGTMRHPQPAQ